MACISQSYNWFSHGCWFLHSYAVMMMLAPLVNVAVDLRGKAALLSLMPLICVVWVWGFGLTLPGVKGWLPHTSGLDMYSGITLLGIYAAARLLRQSDLCSRITNRGTFVMIPLLCLLAGIGLSDYNSPFAFALVAFLFILFKRMHLSKRCSRVVCWIAPSMFSVYLLHTNDFCFGLMSRIETALIERGVPLLISFAVTALFLFMGTLAIDMARRGVLSLICGSNHSAH